MMIYDKNFFIAVSLCALIIIYTACQIIKLGKIIRHIIPKIHNKQIQSYLIDYKNNLITCDKNEISFQRAEDIVNIDNIFKYEQVNIRHYLAIPGQLIGVGVLFTFFGLTVGLWDFDMKHLDESIQNFITALSIKFLTSITGMSSAIIFNFVEKYRFHQLEIEINNLCLELDEDHYQPYQRHFEDYLFNPFVENQKKQLLEISQRINSNFAELKKLNDDTTAIKGGMALLTENIRRNIQESFDSINKQILIYNQKQFEKLTESSEHSLKMLQGLFAESSSKLNEQLVKWDDLLNKQDIIINESTQNIKALL